MIELGQWLPDIPPFENPGVLTANNCVYYGGAYRPFGSVNNVIAALPSTCMGFKFLLDDSGTVQGFAGTATDLYEYASGAWTSRASGFTATRWRFCQFGNTLLAAAKNNQVQAVTLGGGNSFAGVTGTYQAEFIDSVLDFVVLANVYDSSGQQSYQVNWSGINAPTSFAPSVSTQAGSQQISGSHGPITGFIGGEYGVIFQEDAITRMDYVGSPEIFSLTLVEENKGTFLPGSIIEVGNIPGGGRQIFYIGLDGVYSFDGVVSKPIGVNRVNSTLLNDIDMNYPNSMWAEIDPKHDLILWMYAGSGNSGGIPNKILAYNYIQDRFTSLDIGGECLGVYRSPSSSLDYANLNMDTASINMDSNLLTKEYPQVGVSDSAHTISQFNGPSLAAQIIGGDIQLSSGKTKDYMRLATGQAQMIPGRMALINSVRIYSDGTPSVEIGSKDIITDSVSYQSAGTQNRIGLYPVRVNGRYFRPKFSFATGDTWSYLQGYRIEAEEMGER